MISVPFARPVASALAAAALVAVGGVALAEPASARSVAGHGPAGESLPQLPTAPGAAVAPGAAQAALAAPSAARAALAESVLCELVAGLRVCSHGDDAHLEPSTAAGEGGTPASTASTRIGCYRSGPRVQAVYARPATAPDRYSASLASFRGWAGAVEKAVDDSARKTRGARHVRFASVPAGDSCTLSVLRVTLPAEAFTSFSATISALRESGLDKQDVKYLVWAEARGYCGIATTYEDDKPTQDNVNNGRFPSYARVDRACWGRAETHELMHMLGAVQGGAPNATAGLHCRDGSDVMCYDDGSRGSRQTTVCASSHARLLDCRGDDYFNTAPAAGSWLAGHWNTAHSAFLARGWVDPAPAPQPSSPAPAPSSSPAAARPAPTPSPSPEQQGLLPLPLPLPTLLAR